MDTSLDVRAVLVPESMKSALRLMLSRWTGRSTAKEVMEKYYGDLPTFGDLQKTTSEKIERICGSVQNSEVFAELASLVSPFTPACVGCGEFPLASAGGKISSLPAGSACPFCKDGVVALVPMALRTIAWTDGRLVEPQTDYDLRSVPGEKIPLASKPLLDWAGDLSPRIARALSSAKIGPAAFLAYCNLRLRILPSPLAAPEFLATGKGLDKDADLNKIAAKAAEFMLEREITNVPPQPRPIRRRNPDAKRLEIDGRTYLVEGLIGQGDKSSVYRAFWDNQPTEAVVIKICAAMADADLMAREAEALRDLAKSTAAGAHHFTRIIPEVVATGEIETHDGISRPATVFRYKNLHDWTLADVLKEYPDGVDPETMVWMWKRTLMLLGWIHMNDIAHGAVLPQHILIQPLNHAVTLLDWAYAVHDGETFQVFSTAGRDFYPSRVWDGGRVTWITDIIMSARCMIALLGGDPATGSVPVKVPAPIADYLRHHGGYGPTPKPQRVMTAIEIEQDFGKVAESVYGPRRYHPFAMPRRSR
ncbi:MAG: hypothetical protein AAB692_00780 [Patescibacteria group bacterium]